MPSKSNTSVHNPHDTFVCNLLKRKDEAISFFKGVLPDNIKSKIDFNGLTLSPDTYMSITMQKKYSDIIYSGSYSDDTPINITLIIEHKSYHPQENIRRQLLRYFSGVLDIQEKQNIKPSALPILIFLYHGAKELKDEPLWKIFCDDLSMDIQTYVPLFNIIIVNLHEYDDEKIKTIFDSLSLHFAPLLIVFNNYN